MVDGKASMMAGVMERFWTGLCELVGSGQQVWVPVGAHARAHASAVKRGRAREVGGWIDRQTALHEWIHRQIDGRGDRSNARDRTSERTNEWIL